MSSTWARSRSAGERTPGFPARPTRFGACFRTRPRPRSPTRSPKLDLTGCSRSTTAPTSSLNFATTLDGRAAIYGQSGAIGSDDRHRDAAASPHPRGRGDDRRRHDARRALRPHGLRPRTTRLPRAHRPQRTTRLAVIVSNRFELPWDAPLFTDGGGRVVIFTASEEEPPETATPVTRGPPP